MSLVRAQALVARCMVPVGLSVMLIACGESRIAAPIMPAPVADPVASDAAANMEPGRKVYNFRCYYCHGYSGDARTLAATYLTPPPRDFTRGGNLTKDRILQAVRQGRDGTAMKSFGGILAEAEIQAVATFVEQAFVRDKTRNAVYHSAENGWPDHTRYAIAFPFATGVIKLDAPTESLDEEQLRGRRLFLSTCVSCHDRGHVMDEGPVWSARPLSYPRMGFVPGQSNRTPVDVVSSASVYAKHEVVPVLASSTALEQRGEALFQANCAFCHGADGTGKNWIGQFMEPKARDLTAYTTSTMPPERLRETIRNGLPGTSMPAWRDVLDTAQIEAIMAYVARLMRHDPQRARTGAG